MEVKKFREYCAQKVFYTVTEEWCYYSNTLLITDDKQEAITYWENRTKRNYNSYSEYVCGANCNVEGFWYFGLNEHTYGEMIDLIEKNAKYQVDLARAEELAQEKEKRIARMVRYEEQEKNKEVIRGLVYYLEKCYGSLCSFGDEDKRVFEKITSDWHE